VAYVSSPRLRIETFQTDSCIQGQYHVFEEPNHRGRIELRARKNNEDPYAVAAIRRSADVGHVPRNMSAACALLLRRRGPSDMINFE